jgi:hypothetical protein
MLKEFFPRRLSITSARIGNLAKTIGAIRARFHDEPDSNPEKAP